jgi:hypothetical protein
VGDKVVDEEGNVYERGWDGQYRQKQGIFGPQRETDVFGNAKVDRDLLGNPKAKTNWLGSQQTSSSGRGLYSSGSGSNNDLAVAIVGFLLGITILAIIGIIRLLYHLCRNHPSVGYPLVAALAVISAIAIVTSSTTTTARTSQSAPVGPGAAIAPSPPTAAQVAIPTPVPPTPTLAPPPTAAPILPNASVQTGRPASVVPTMTAPTPPSATPARGSIDFGSHLGVSIRVFDPQRDQSVPKVGQLIPGFKVSDQLGYDHFQLQLAPTRTVNMSWGWCATTPAVLSDDLRFIQTTLVVDSSAVDVTPFQRQWTEPSYTCQGPDAVFSSWDVGHHVVRWTRHISQRLSDGEDEYAPGDYGAEYAVTVQ